MTRRLRRESTLVPDASPERRRLRQLQRLWLRRSGVRQRRCPVVLEEPMAASGVAAALQAALHGEVIGQLPQVGSKLDVSALHGMLSR